MKKSFLFICLCSLLLSACHIGDIKINGGAMIEPSENIVKKEYPLKNFDKIDIDVMANVKFIQSTDGKSRVVLSAPENYVELFSFEVDGSELEATHTRSGINLDTEHVDVTIYSPTLKSLENDGLAVIEMTHLKTDRLEVDNTGVGSMYLTGLDVKELMVDCSGVGSIELGGKADKAELECSGVGSIEAQQLKAKSVRGEVSGVGGIKCYAIERIDAEVSGVGSLEYGGSPKDKRFERTGVGSINAL